MKNWLTIIAALGMSVMTALPTWACTNLLVGKKASATGSTMISYSADSHSLYGELYYTPASDHAPGAMRKVIEWDTQKYLGEIPQPAHTWRVVGNMNEHQLTIAESTWGGNPKWQDTTGIIDYGSLIYITLERATNAREAIDVMIELVETYGYYSSGESFSIGDPQEIWVMEMIGKGPGNKGALWVAQRIPDDCISGHANQARIHTFPQEKGYEKNGRVFVGGKAKQGKLATAAESVHCIYSAELIPFARANNLFDGADKDFDFSKTFGEHDYLAYRGCDGRVWAYFNRYASGMDRYFPFVDMQPGAEILPLYVKPDRPLTHRDVQTAMRDHFENTPWDMNTDVGGGPFHSPYRFRPLTWKVDSVEYLHERAIATQQTGFTFVAEMRGWLPDEVGGKIWFATDDAATTFYAPIYNNIQEAPLCFRVGNGDMLTFSWTSAFWMTNWVANQAYARYDQMIGDIVAVRDSLEDRFDAQQDSIDQQALALLKQGTADATAFLTQYSAAEANGATAAYKDLGIYLLVKFLDGNVKREKNGTFERTPEGIPASPMHPAYSEDFYRAIVRQRGDELRMR